MNRQPEQNCTSRRSSSLWTFSLLVILVTAVYWPVGSFEFVTFDDPLYVTENTRVQAGLTLENVK